MTPDFLSHALARGLISPQQADALWRLHKEMSRDAAPAEHEEDQGGEASTPAFRLSVPHLLWAGGAALILSALILLGDALSDQGDWALAWLLSGYAAGFAGAALGVARLEVPDVLWACLGGCAVLLFGAASFVFHETYLDLNELSRAGPFAITQPISLDETPAPVPPARDLWLAAAIWPAALTLSAAAAFLVRARFLPIWLVLAASAFAIVYEITRLIFFGGQDPDDVMRITGVLFGLAVLLLALWADVKSPVNHGFWLNKAGWFFFGIGMALVYELGGGWEALCVGVFLVSAFYSVFIRRPGGVSFAAIGLFGFLAENLSDLLDGAWLAIALCTLVGACLIAVGLFIFRREDAFAALLPQGLRAMRPAARDDPVTFGF